MLHDQERSKHDFCIEYNCQWHEKPIYINMNLLTHKIIVFALKMQAIPVHLKLSCEASVHGCFRYHYSRC